MKIRWFLLAMAALGGWQVYAAHRWGAEAVQERVYLVTAVIAVVFMVMYARDAWFTNWFGRSLMLIAVAFLLVGVSVILYRTFGPDYPFRPVLIILTADVSMVAMLSRTLVLRWAQRQDKRRRDTPVQPEEEPKQ
jgi:hypothetical protein